MKTKTKRRRVQSKPILVYSTSRNVSNFEKNNPKVVQLCNDK